MKCSWCGLPIPVFVNLDPPRCKFCNAIVCSPHLRDCGYEHWRDRHSNREVARKVEDLRPL